MSKKTKAEKQKRQQRGHRRPRRSAYIGKAHKNPAFDYPNVPVPGPGLFGDFLFMHHFAGAILRALQIYSPQSIEGPYLEPPGAIDAEFVDDEPKGPVQ